MIKFLILTHGNLARELLESAQKIAGESGCMAALALDWDDPPAAAREKTERAIARLAPGDDGLLILTDMFGGTPHNVAQSFRQPGRVEVVSGVSLPMVLRLGCRPKGDLGLAELAEWIARRGRKSIRVGGS